MSRRAAKDEPRRVLIGVDGRDAGGFLGPALAALGAEIRQVRTGAELERALERDGPFHLVVSAANLPDKTGLGVMAHTRALGIKTPFVVVVATHLPRMRILLSQSGGEVLSSRMLDQANLVALATELTGLRGPDVG